MLKSPVNIVSLFFDGTLISELRRSSLKFFGRNFDLDGGLCHTLIRKLFVLGKFVSSLIHSNSLISKSVLLINGMPSFINCNATVCANMSIFVNEGVTRNLKKAVLVMNYWCTFPWEKIYVCFCECVEKWII